MKFPKEYGIPAATSAFLGLLMAMTLIFFIWAHKGALDVVSRAPGEVVPFSKIKTVQHLEGGIVREILVKEGESVGPGQPLVILESIARYADVAEQNIQIKSLQVKILRLRAEINGDEKVVFSHGMKTSEPELTRNAEALFDTRKKRLESQIKVQESLIRQYRFQIEEIRASLGGTGQVRAFIEEQVAISEKLLKNNLSNRMNHIELLRQLADLKARQKVDEASLKRIQEAIQEAGSRLDLVTSTFIEEAHDELRDAIRTLDIVNERIHKDEDSLKRTVVRSPVEGTVKTLFVATIGGIVSPGGVVVEIVPAEDRLIIEARLPVGDIGYVQVGQKVVLRVASSSDSGLGHIDGEVIHISPDSIVVSEGPPFYKIKITAFRDYFGREDVPYNLFPGMLINCSIITGNRTVLEYLLGPFMLSMESAMLER
ncbi:MAG: HlyD family type I secretion periplasmic adaptor subunit [Desulfamplus sp.]|nr:HlyD family type I secretion periplasmic adaptor subunit [Desulfamplus sp.]